MICRAREGCQTSRDAVDRAPARGAPAPPVARRATLRYSPGVWQNRLAAAVRAVLSSPGPRRRRRSRETPEAPIRILGNVSTGATKDNDVSARDPRHPIPVRGQGYPSSDQPHRRIRSTNGRKAGLASRSGRAAGLALPGQLRDVAARHPARRRRRAALPDRGPERLRQGLAGVPLPLADQPDAGPHRRLQRPGRVRHRADAGRRRPAEPDGGAGGRGRPAGREPRSGSSRPGSVARAGRPTSTRATRSPTSSSGRPTAWPTPPACRSPSDPATPTTRSSCTAAWASARPT